MKFEDLNDMSIYYQLEEAVLKSIEKIHHDYSNNDYTSVVGNLQIFKNINLWVEELNWDLSITHRVFTERKDGVFHIE